MAYYFYNTLDKLERKVNELERELKETEKKFSLMVSTNASQREVNVLELDLENLVTKLKFFKEGHRRLVGEK